jgi:dUTP pyrophosphatase
MKPISIKIKAVHQNAVMPTYATDGSGAFDLYAATVDNSAMLGNHVVTARPLLCGTGLAFQIPADHVMLIFSRSGHGFKHGVRLSNCVGVIDSDYTGEVMVQLAQDDRIDKDTCDLVGTFISPGERVAQAIVIPRPACTFEWADDLNETGRGAGGFGSTGA